MEPKLQTLRVKMLFRPRKEKGNKTSSILKPRYSSCLFVSLSENCHYFKETFSCTLLDSPATTETSSVFVKHECCSVHFHEEMRKQIKTSACCDVTTPLCEQQTAYTEARTATIQIFSAYIFAHMDTLDSSETIMRIWQTNGLYQAARWFGGATEKQRER
jgi:hypothetical protein